jgi:hypothetical protein
MTVHRLNGRPIDLHKMSDDELWRLGEYIGRNQDQLEREIELVNQELTRRALNRSFNPVA